MKIGFVSTRLAGTDGVSLETAKWATVLGRKGHQIFYCAGELDPSGPPGLLVPEMHFEHPLAMTLGQLAFGTTTRSPRLDQLLAEAQLPILEGLRAFIRSYQIDILIAENCLAIPMNLALGLALRRVIQETGIVVLGHHHDFAWERERFAVNVVADVLEAAFPPDLPRIVHAVINRPAQAELERRRAIPATVVPNVFDFRARLPGIDDYNRDLRAAIGISAGDLFILQPTRVVPRKGIELAIELARRLNEPNARLVITHHAGDEGPEYLNALRAQAAAAGVDLRYVAEHFAPERRDDARGKLYSLWDAYPHADLVTYPSLYEGWGNALIEAVYFRRPLVVNRYQIYDTDIRPVGFRVVEMQGAVTEQVVEQTRALVHDPALAREMTEHNFEVGARHFSYEALDLLLDRLLSAARR